MSSTNFPPPRQNKKAGAAVTTFSGAAAALPRAGRGETPAPSKISLPVDKRGETVYNIGA